MKRVQLPDGDQMGYVTILTLLTYIASGLTWWVGLGAFAFWYLTALLGRNIL